MGPSLLLCSIAAILIQSHGCKASGQKSEPGMLFTRHPQPFVAPLGDAIDFECSLNLAAEKFIWRHRPLNSNKWLILDSGFSGAGKTSKYVVNFDNEAKAGDYRCVAFYGTSGLASDPARLTQARIDNFSDDEDVFLRISPGNNVPIVCPVPYSMPEAVIQFYKDGNPIQYASLAGSKTMLIEKAKPSNSGFYHCLANNYITSETYASNYKTVLNIDKNLTDQAPYFINKPQTEYKVLRGHNVTLGCLAVGNPVPQVKWTKLEGNQIGDLPIRSSYSPMGLTIYNLQPSDKGEYECMWSNRVSRIKAIISLTVVEPPSVIKPPKLSTFPEGGELELSCNTTGYPAPQVEWLINGETLLPNKNVHTKGSTLFISLVEKKHAGIVQCVASNEYGSQSGYNMLRVSPKQHAGGTKTRVEYGMGNSGHKHTRGGGRRRGKDGRRKGDKAVLVPPDQPNVTRLSDYSVMVRWNVPENHGLPIQFFKVQYREIGNQRPNGKQAKWMTANTEIPSHVRSFEVADLTPNHTYKFRIAAVYSNNDNMVSQISSKFLLNHDEGFESNRMPIPLLTNTEALSPSEVLLIWQNPDKSQNIDGFYVYYRASTSAGDYIKTTVEGKFSTNITISHLQPDTTYEFKVQSFSVDAASEFSQILRQRTKKVVTEVPPIEQNLPENNNVNTVENAKNSNIYAIIGGIFGGTVLLIGLAAVGLAYKRKKTKQNRETTPTPDVYFIGKPMTNGRIMNGGITDSKMNITSNPLAGLESTEDPMQPKNGLQSPMEMASFFNGQNNNGSCCLPNPQQDINSVGLPPVSGVVVNSMQGDLPPTVLMQGPRPIEQPL